jgi:hypothetical protein
MRNSKRHQALIAALIEARRNAGLFWIPRLACTAIALGEFAGPAG